MLKRQLLELVGEEAKKFRELYGRYTLRKVQGDCGVAEVGIHPQLNAVLAYFEEVGKAPKAEIYFVDDPPSLINALLRAFRALVRCERFRFLELYRNAVVGLERRPATLEKIKEILPLPKEEKKEESETGAGGGI